MSEASSYSVVGENAVKVGDQGNNPRDLVFSLPQEAILDDRRCVLSFRATFHGDADDFRLELTTGRTGDIDGKAPMYVNTFNNADDVPVPRQLQFVVKERTWKTDNNNVVRLRKGAGDGTLTIDDVVVWYHWKAAS